MNVLFHLVAGFGITLALIDSEKTMDTANVVKTTLAVSFLAFVSHALLDYTPHCYPINSKVDFIGGGLLLLVLSFFARKPYRPIIFFGLLASVLPDLIDLLPAIFNKYIGWRLPIYAKIFPWHWKVYSGSIYSGNCDVSNINIGMILMSVLLIILLKRKLFKDLYPKSN